MRTRDFFVDGEGYMLVFGATAETRIDDHTEVPAPEVVELARRWIADGRWGAAEALANEVFSPNAGATWARDVDRFLAEVRDRVPFVFRVYRAERPQMAVNPIDVAPIDLVDLASEEEAPVLTWVEVEFRGTDDKPMREVAVEIELPDGSVQDIETNAFGVARVEDISEPGQCKFKFPKLEEMAPASS